MAEASSPQIIIHHVEGRRSQRIVWFCEELGLPYELSFVRGEVGNSFLQIRVANPLMPAAPSVSYNGKMLVESGAILEYLQQKEGRGALAPDPESADYADHLVWLHFAEGSAMPTLIADMEEMRRSGAKTLERRPYRNTQAQKIDSHDVLAFAEDHLARHSYFGGGDFSIADIMMHMVPMIANMIPGMSLDNYPKLAAWRQSVESRPAFGRSMAASLPDGKVPG